MVSQLGMTTILLRLGFSLIAFGIGLDCWLRAAESVPLKSAARILMWVFLGVIAWAGGALVWMI